jgi:DNA-binding beta-propeller fold protein YncE
MATSSSRRATPRRGWRRARAQVRQGRQVHQVLGRQGNAPGQFVVAHGIVIDSKGLLWVMDRENQRVQVFDQNGTFVREQKYKGLPCSVVFGRDEAFMVNGFAGSCCGSI